MTTETIPWADRVAKWFDDRNLTKGSTPEKQWPKLKEEFEELKAGVEANDLHEIRDGIGDVMVVLRGMAHMRGIGWQDTGEYSVGDYTIIDSIGRTIDWMEKKSVMSLDFVLMDHIRACAMYLGRLARDHGLTIEECKEQAWNDIKDRTGKMIDGVFVKDA